MAEGTLNLFDFIKFPDVQMRKQLRNVYPAISELKQIKTDPSQKYNGKQVPIEFMDYKFTVSTWVREYNYSVFILNIPLFQFLDVYRIMSTDIKQEQLPYLTFLLNYYSELLAYYIDWAFKKSVNIFNAMFGFKINDDKNSFTNILKEIKKRSKSNKVINKVKMKLQEFSGNHHYQDIILIRNKNTHSIRSTQSGHIDIYDASKGVTFGTIHKPIRPDEVVFTILESIKLLGEYTEFIEEIIDEYYGLLYNEYVKNNSIQR